jgi:hypothetical protein
MGNFKYFSTLLIFTSCLAQKDKPVGRDVNVFRDSPAWDVALAIRDQDNDKVKSLLKGKPLSIINFRDKYYGQSLLNWAVYRDNYESAKILIEAGADPNLKGYDSTSAVIHAADKAETSDYLCLMLKYGGNPNSVADIDAPQHLRTPLIAAAYKRLESVKMLIDAGANPNFIYRISRGNIGGETIQSALIYAFYGKKIDVVKFLIVETGVEFNYVMSTTIDGNPHYILYYLRDLVFPLDSEQYKIKMEVVNYLKTKGLDYWREPIPELYKKQYDKSFLEKY